MFLPTIAYAITYDKLYNNIVDKIINPAITLLFTVALIIFLWGVMEYIRGKEASDARKQGKDHIIWGIVGITIMLGVWGIIAFVNSSFEFDSPKNVNINQQIKYQKETTN